ncbi:MAG: ATP synthase F0 subunit B [Flavobacteriales bacterium]|nr:ATP synthase F0 subunit B [Flavobacteriales bacterium]|tara:strand:+ start:2602 stop:3102 length:501 start_codon:yes stop_codon:yes gene_type:complete
MEKLIAEFSVGLFFWQTLLFLALLFLLRKFAWKPILGAVNSREESIKKALDSAKEAEEKMASLTAQNEEFLKQAREERDVILREAKEAKDAIVSEAKGQAKEEADRILVLANEQIANERMKAVTELKNQVGKLSLEIAEKILTAELDDKSKQEALVNNLVEDVNLN